jgi:hypothetical protein
MEILNKGQKSQMPQKGDYLHFEQKCRASIKSQEGFAL